MITWRRLVPALLIAAGCTNELKVFERIASPSPDASTSVEAGTGDGDADVEPDAGDASSAPDSISSRGLGAFEHTCAIMEGRLYCWGDNGDLQLGLGDHEVRSSPTPVAESSLFLEVCAGDSHSCALRADGMVLCWGDNFHGELGVGDNTPRDRPTEVGSTRYAKLACWSNVSCAIGLEGRLFCWGENFEGQLGQNDGAGSAGLATPTPVAPDLRFREVSVGQGHVCAITQGGELYCWGRNTQHQLGVQPEREQIRTPTRVDPSRLYRRVAAGMLQTCAIERTGKLYCWGIDVSGQLGLGLSPDTSVQEPAQVGVEADYTVLRTSWFHTCAIRSNGSLTCWGRNVEGQLGVSDTDNRNVPARVGTETDWLDVTTGHFHSCGIRTDGIYCWGENNELNQLGLGAPGRRSEPTPVKLPLQ
jgi:alpha-tubulin suppressor-like RCC1 family protein